MLQWNPLVSYYFQLPYHRFVQELRCNVKILSLKSIGYARKKKTDVEVLYKVYEFTLTIFCNIVLMLTS